MKAIERREQIRERAGVLFREKGFAATSMRDLAVDLGIEAASLYNHVASKDEILRDICFSMAESFFQAIAPIVASESQPKEKLRAMIAAHLTVIAARRDASAVFLHEWRHLANPALDEFRQMRKRYERNFQTVIEDGIVSGAFRPIDPRLLVRTILSATNWTYDWLKPQSKAGLTETIDALCTVLLEGVAL